jgi:iron(III) transport system substrate-binding protein
MKLTTTLIAAAMASLSFAVQAEELNLYSARHYQTDEALYANFTKQTGIKINRIEGKEDELLERIKNEGANSPADIFLTVDAARLAKAHELGLFAPLTSKTLESRIPAHLRTDDWFSFSTRARVIIYNKASVKAEDIQNYADLANPKLKGKFCSRSGSHPYNLSLMASVIAHDGEAKAEEWAKGMVANFARAPKGGDTDQIKAVAAGECGVAISNTYYVARLLRSTKPEELKMMEKVGVIWPNQSTTGTHINVSGGGMLKTAPHKDAAVKFLEYLSSDDAQRYFADGNNEWPAVDSVKVANPGSGCSGKIQG